MPETSDAALTAILRKSTRVAVIGASTTPEKAAHNVPAYLQRQGYDVIPVNPYAETVLGQPTYDDISDVPAPVDIVEVFRPSDEVAGIVDAVLDRSDEPVIWLQLGIHDDDAVARAEAAGLSVVQDRCMMVSHRRLLA